jgi:hypothetical protein
LITRGAASPAARQPGIAGAPGSEKTVLRGINRKLLDHIFVDRDQGIPVNADGLKPRPARDPDGGGGHRRSPRVRNGQDKKRAERWDAAVRDHGDGQVAAEAAKAGVTRSIFEYLMGAGTGKLHELGGALQRRRGHGAIIDVEAPSREPTLDEQQSAFYSKVKKEISDGTFRQWQSLVQRPPLPYFRPRRGALPPGACASAYTVQPILLWDPVSYFEFTGTTCRCHHCGGTRLRHKGYTAGKTIEDINGPIRFYAKRMSCKDCKEPSQSDDDGFLDLFPPFVRTVFETQCGVHTYKLGMSSAVGSIVNFIAASQESFSAVPKMLREIQGERSWTEMKLYAQYHEWDRKNATIEALKSGRGGKHKLRLFTPHERGLSQTSSRYYMDAFATFAKVCLFFC